MPPAASARPVTSRPAPWCCRRTDGRCCSPCTRGWAAGSSWADIANATDSTLAGAALREATEESGIDGLQIDPMPVHLDVHPVTCSLGVPTRHFDVRYRVIAPAGSAPVISDESDDLRFWLVDDLPPGFDEADRELIAAALAR